ncbi:hypothetical protein M3Y95_00718100 [Aphelenchoides besseyi]|nr:hypothetical protein M3Y95_00718100 [Aphelenchoides besseyi]
MIVDKNITEVFKSTNVPNPDRRYIRFVSFIRDPRTGLHGLVVFKSDSYQIWSITGYDEKFEASLNKSVRLFPVAPLDVQLYGRGNTTQIMANNLLSILYKFEFDQNADQFDMSKIQLNEALYIRRLPNRPEFIAATRKAKLSRYSIDGQKLNEVEIPNKLVPKSFTISANGKTAAVGASHDSIRTLKFTADGNEILVGGQRGIIKLFTFEDLGTETRWENTRSFSHHRDKVISICSIMTSEGETFASSSADGVVCLWSLRQEDPIHVFRLSQEAATALCFSPDGKYFAYGTDEGNLRVYKIRHDTDYVEPQEFADEDTLRNQVFWHLEGPSFFDLEALRKSLGAYNENEDTQIFWKIQCNPDMKLRDAYAFVNEETLKKKEREKIALRKIRLERRRARRVVIYKYKVDQMRTAAQRKGREFVEPQMPAFDTEPEDDENLSDIDAAFAEFEEPPAEEVPTKTQDNKENRVQQSNDVVASSPSIDDSQRSSPTEIQMVTAELAERSGILLSDSDEDDAKSPNGSAKGSKKSTSASPTEDPQEQPQLWATDDEMEKNDEDTEMNATNAGGDSVHNTSKGPVHSTADNSDNPDLAHEHRSSSSGLASPQTDLTSP